MTSPVPPSPPQSYPRSVLDELARRAEATADREVCGFVVRRGGRLEVVAVPNVAEAARAPSAFVMDPIAALRSLRRLGDAEDAVVAVYHSHVDCPALLSAADRDAAVAGGAPLWPGVEQLVLGVRAGRAVEIRRYRFEGDGYVEVGLD